MTATVDRKLDRSPLDTDPETTSAETSADASGTMDESATGAMDPMMASIMTACNADSTMLVIDAATQAQAAGGDATADQ